MKRKTITIAMVLLTTASVGCKKKQAAKAQDPVVATGSAAVAAGSGSAGSGSAGSGSADPGSGSGSGSAVAGIDPGELSTPESVLYDADRDMYLVSNINGKPTDVDDNGFIKLVNPDGSNERAAANVKWIDGAAEDIKLNAPKGMAISGDTLFVADITVVRQFEAKSGKQKADIEIKGASFLNDVVSDGAGGVYVSDTGFNAEFEPTGTDAVWHVAKDGKVTPLIKNKDLGNPNGLAAGEKGSVWVVTMGSGEIFEVNAKGAKQKPVKLPKGRLDGIVALPGGEFLVSSWDASAVYRGKPGGEWKAVGADVESPADIGFDSKRKLILIPSFMTNALVVRPLE